MDPVPGTCAAVSMEVGGRGLWCANRRHRQSSVPFLLELTVIREWLLWQRGMGSRIWGRVELLLNLTYIFMEDSLWQTMYPMIKTSVSLAGETT